MELRDYQEKTISGLYQWFYEHKGNPCIVLPTGAGKSVIIAGFCRKALTDWPETRILMLTHQKELIEQDAQKLRDLWPEGDIGICSAGIGLKQYGHAITFGSIQTLYRHTAELGHIDLIMVDEAHLINAKATGMYRDMIAEMQGINPHLKVIGLTATPYRLGHGMITDKPALFSGPLIEPVTIQELQDLGFLCKLTSKATGEKLRAVGVSVTAGEYNQKQLQEAVDIPGKTAAVVNEAIRRAGDRKSWLFFCSGIEHAQHVCDLLNERGINAACVTGKTPKEERERLLEAFKNGEYTAMTNANVLTTGFDNPKIDLIVMMRPTLSPGLYIQMAGRGLRPYPGKSDCLVLDFAGNVAMHGPITQVKPPKKKGEGRGVAPCKTCPNCQEIVPLQTRTCPECGHEFPDNRTDKRYQLSEADINGSDRRTVEVKSWTWEKRKSKAGNDMIVVTYFPKVFNEKAVSQFLLIWHDNPWVRNESKSILRKLIKESGLQKTDAMTTRGLCDAMNFKGKVPSTLEIRRDGKYDRFVSATWAGGGTVNV